MYESLHNHTTASDGTQTYAEVLATAERLGYGTIAFTDHDMLPNEQALADLSAYRGPVKWILGCEISSGLPKELGGGPTGMFHILGLFTDPNNQSLREHCRTAHHARIERMEKMVANLNGLGFKLTVDECFEESKGENVGRPHIVRALFRHPENQTVITALREQMAQEAMKSPQVAMDYMRMMEQDPSDYPYRLFLSEDAFIPGIYIDYLYSIDMDESVKLIRDAGGRAILAHWPTVSRKISLEMVKGFLEQGRLDGLELRSGFVDSQVVRQGEALRKLVDETGSSWTIGVDGHAEKDLVYFAQNRELADQTIGQTKRLIERFKPDLPSCSSL